MIKKIIKKGLVALYALILLVHLLLLYFGMASVISMALFLFSSFLLMDFVLKKVKRKRISEFRTALWALFTGILIAELSLRYVFKTHLSYPEQNGEFYYSSAYRQILFANVVRKYIFRQEDVGLFFTPYNQHIEQTSEFSYLHTFNKIGIRDNDYAVGGGIHLL